MLTALLVAIIALSLVAVHTASAHPLGNFSVNQYSRIEVGTTDARIVYVLDLAELPTLADGSLLDANNDGAISNEETDAYLATRLAEIVPNLHLIAGGKELPLTLTDRSLSFVAGQAGLNTTRLEATLTAPLPPGSSADAMTYRNDYATDRLGWREIVVVNGNDVRLDNATSLAADRSQELSSYPQDLLSSPLDERDVTFSYQIALGAVANGENPTVSLPGPLGIGERLSEIVNGGTLSLTGMALALLAAAAWGAVHALSPGHGKTVVGAYLVGSRGTPRHALFLGLTVTITHTAGVVALGVIVLFASRTILPEQLYPWLSLISGLLVAALGLTILRQRVLGIAGFGHHHDHDHDHAHSHSHDHAHMHAHGIVHSHGGHTHSHVPPGGSGEKVTWRNLLALGISGGLLPCPSALLALLGAVAIGRAGFGLAIVLAFSVGLAATLTGIGILFLYAGRFLERRTMSARWSGLLQYAPAAAALLVTVSGVMLVARAVMELH